MISFPSNEPERAETVIAKDNIGVLHILIATVYDNEHYFFTDVYTGQVFYPDDLLGWISENDFE